MRRSRRLTSTERWELGVFLGMLMLGCVGLTILFEWDRIPGLSAMRSQPVAGAPLAQTAPPLAFATPAPSLPLAGNASAIAPSNSTAGTADELAGPLDPSLIPGEGDTGTPRPRLAPKPTEDIRFYNGIKYRYVRTMKLRVTAYAPDPRCCWPYAGTTTASGLSVKTNHGKLVAADTSVIPMHALVAVPGYSSGAPVPVLDRGSAIKGSRLDVLLPSFAQAQEWGTKVLSVRIYMPAD